MKNEFPKYERILIKKFKYMHKLAGVYSKDEFVQAPLAQITWYHNIALMEKVSKNQERLWYAEKTL